MKNLLLFCAIFLIATYSYSQLGFCNGSKGDPIFFENFGSGTNFGPPLPIGTTSYNYISGSPEDGFYTLYYRTNANPNWHNAPDHTPDSEIDGTDGKSLIVNASFTAGEFYKRTVSNLCVNTDFEFTAWVMNIAKASDCQGNTIPNDITFEIWNASETILLKSGITGPILSTNTPIWQQFGLTFTTLPGETSVILKMKNNGVGGCGNDLAIDDITFRSCGDFTNITSPGINGPQFSTCESNLPVQLELNAIISNTLPHVFQWQSSDDAVTWTTIASATNASYTTNVTATQYFRVKIAQDVANLANSFCYTLSEYFTITILPQPFQPGISGDSNFLICGDDSIPTLTVITNGGDRVDWFDAPVGGNLLATNTNTYTPTEEGAFYAESYTQIDCRSVSRAPFAIQISPSPEIPPIAAEPIILCENKTVDLTVIITGVTYQWSTVPIETTQSITVSEPGIYTIIVTNSAGCTDSQSFTVVKNLIPIITEVLTSGNTVTIKTEVDGDYEYSLDGNNFQMSNVFNFVSGGQKTAYVRERNRCGEDETSFLLLIIPSFFTPNGDGFNDVFHVEGLELIPDARISIFDRYGKLLFVISTTAPQWNGNFNGFALPSTDYWYRAELKDREVKGHFSLKK